jgi:hypothetical protein
MATQSTTTRLSADDDATRVLRCIKHHLPTLREAYRYSGSRKMRLLLKDFELIVQRSEQPKQTD